jgi:hypothetical protein
MKVLVATMPYVGNLKFQPVAAELIRRGHEVLWLSGEAFRERVEITGATFVSPKLLVARYHLLWRTEYRRNEIPRYFANRCQVYGVSMD